VENMMTEQQAQALLPQKHCRDLDDHPAHDHRGGSLYCPGRFTPTGFTSGVGPMAPADPFAGIPGTDSDDEW
jgi:hypothetical protein